jgi:hypothetical protein
MLRDVLRLAGLEDSAHAIKAGVRHVHFEGADKPFGVSIPINKAISNSGDVMLAYHPRNISSSEAPRVLGWLLRFPSRETAPLQ